MSAPSQALTDSPWFWAYVFATGAVVSLLLGSPRLHGRQEQIERQFLARQRAGQVVGVDPTASASDAQTASGDEMSAHEAIISFAPLRIAMIVVLCLAWTVFLYQRRFGARGRVAALDDDPQRSVS